MKYNTKKSKIILVPYPAQGHITPMLRLASTLSNLFEFSPVVILPEFIHRSIAPQTDIPCMSIPDCLDVSSPHNHDFFSIETAMENYIPVHLEGIIRKLDEEEDGGGGGVACMFVDLLASWAIKVGVDYGVQVAGFWPAMFATYKLIAAIPELVSLGIISETGIPKHEGPICLSQGLPTLSTEELPWLIGNSTSRKSRFKFWTRTLERSKTLQWILVNTFPEEHVHCNASNSQNQSITNRCEDYLRIFPIGPLIKHTQRKSPSLWEEDKICLDWLDKQRDNSVVYISFGSWVSPIGEGKVKSLAMALKASGRPFIWVLGPKWREGLPKGYLERIWKQGRVVSWAPQNEVLQHRAVGCFLTHCGWNSTLEAIKCKKRLLCYPVMGDQFVNCAYIVKLWRIGVKIHGFGEKDVEEGLETVMKDVEMHLRLVKLNESIFGKETSLRVVENLTIFVNYIKKSL